MEKKVLSNKYYEIILDWFKAQIISGQLNQGDTIPSERELASRFGVSRVPVREALRILEYIGIISNSPEGMKVQKIDIQFLNPKANFAADITRETIENLFEVRIFLESGAAYYAAQRRTDDDISQIRGIFQQMSNVINTPDQDDEAMIKASHEFHFRVIAAAKNPVLENMYRSLYDLLQVSKQYTINSNNISESTLLEHEAILGKIESRNAEEAARYMRFHLNRARESLDGAESMRNGRTQ